MSRAKRTRKSKKSRTSRASRASRKITTKLVNKDADTVSRLRSRGRDRKLQSSKTSKLIPRTAKIHVVKTPVRRKFSRARDEMPITDLQFMAKSLGIPFGGLSKTQLVRKINNYI